MNNSSPGILIIGGGVTGLAAAQLLSEYDATVHLVEKEEALGGHAAQWACMATESCLNCGACLSLEMAALIRDNERITVHTGTAISKIDRAEADFTVSLENNQTIRARKIIAATGFSPFDARRIASCHTDTLSGVITTAELNRHLRNDTLDGCLDATSAPRIAFIQCVGSRNRKIGSDYCSQVCCKISMRQANKLLYLYPEARITIFYMDLQIIGKEVRAFYEELAGKVELVQGVPAEILGNRESGKLNIIAEDRDNMTRIAREFDMAVLSVGLQPARDMEKTTALLQLTPDSLGFFNTPEAATAPDIHVAGCARGPGDILSSIQDGRAAAGKVIDALDLVRVGCRISADEAIRPEVAVFGEGPQALRIAGAIAANGYRTRLFGTTTSSDTSADASDDLIVMSDASVQSVSGTAGAFTIRYGLAGRRKSLTCAAIIAAWEPEREGIDPGVSPENIITPAAFASLVSRNPENLPDTIAILLDYAGPEHKTWARTALEDALRSREAGKKVYLLANKILVHRADGQRLYDRARKAGMHVLRYERSEDITIEETGAGLALRVKEATLPAATAIRLECGCLVLPPRMIAPADFIDKAALLGVETDREGLMQAANVRHRLTRSNRRGIFFAGAGHDEVDDHDIKAEIDDILVDLKTLLPVSEPSSPMVDGSEMSSGVVVNERMCAGCLTCFRICPHGAVVLGKNMKPRIIPEACFSCYLCLANCPACAIESDSYTNDALAGTAVGDRTVVFACERSAWLAAAGESLPDTVGLVRIPCTCRISTNLLLKTLLEGAFRVVVAGCHDGNCRSMKGARAAAAGIRQVQRIPGVTEEQIFFTPVAANETAGIRQIVSKA